MKKFARLLKRLTMTSLIIGTFSILPLIPMQESPVVQFPIPRNVNLSFLGLMLSHTMVGVRHQPTGMTLPIIVAMVVAAIFLVRHMDRRFFGQRNQPGQP